MVKWLFISFLCESGFGGLCLVWSFIVFDRIVKGLYSANRVEWEKLGMPIGFFWVPKELKKLDGKGLFASSVARSSFFKSVSKSPGEAGSTISNSNYSTFRVATLLGRVFFGAGFACFIGVLIAIFR